MLPDAQWQSPRSCNPLCIITHRYSDNRRIRHPDTHTIRDIESQTARLPDAPPPGNREATTLCPSMSQSPRRSRSTKHTEAQNHLARSNMLLQEPEIPHDLPFRPFAIRSVSSQNTKANTGTVLQHLRGPPHRSPGHTLTRTPSSGQCRNAPCVWPNMPNNTWTFNPGKSLP